jgi:hypothetical protein
VAVGLAGADTIVVFAPRAYDLRLVNRFPSGHRALECAGLTRAASSPRGATASGRIAIYDIDVSARRSATRHRLHTTRAHAARSLTPVTVAPDLVQCGLATSLRPADPALERA